MARFVLSRRWSFILALGASLIWCSAAHRPVAAQVPGGLIGDPQDPGPGGIGDPDMPSGPGKSVGRGKSIRGGNSANLGVRAGGDGSTARSVWMWRLRVVLRGLRSYTVRF